MTERRFKHISVGKDGRVWAADKTDGTIYRLYGDAGFLSWVPDKVGKADVVATVDWGNAWCVNKAHQIWHVTNAESVDKGGTWTQVPTHSGQADARSISVGADGSVWYAQTDGVLFRTARPGDGTGLFWVHDTKEGKVDVVAAVDATNIWGVNNANQIWHWEHSRWTQVPTHSGRADAKTISVGIDGSVWYVDTNGAVYFWQMVAEVWSPAWDQSRMGKADVIAVHTQADVWCLNDKGEVWRTDKTTSHSYQWQQVVERGPDEKAWTYTIKPGDGLMAIVRKKFTLKDPQDTQEINRLVDLIVAQNHRITRDKINAGDVLTLRY